MPFRLGLHTQGRLFDGRRTTRAGGSFETNQFGFIIGHDS